MLDNAERVRIRASGLFDEDFYRHYYAPSLSAADDALDHFMSIGAAQGFLPSERFDPVLYRMLVPGCAGANPLLHRLASGEDFDPPELPALFPRITLMPEKRAIPGDEPAPVRVGTKRGRTYKRDAAALNEMTYDIDGRSYTLRAPSHEQLLERLAADRPFAYARLPHGFWDTVWMLEHVESLLAADERTAALSAPERRSLAERLCSALRTGKGNFAPRYIDEILADAHAHAGQPDFMRAVAFRGSPGDPETLPRPNRWPPQDDVRRVFARHYSPDDVLYDAMLWKRLLVAGPLKVLPDLCREHPVVLVANPTFASLGERWRLPDFTHIRIPVNHTQWQRWRLLDRVSQALRKASRRGKKAPIFLSQCGGSVAYWLVARLYSRFQGVFYVDVGQALDGWFIDVLDKKANWPRSYARTIIENCELGPYYESLLGRGYREWMHGLGKPGRREAALRPPARQDMA